MIRATSSRRGAIAVATLLLAGCATSDPMNSWFDSDTALTCASLREPLVVARSVNRVSVAGRDYAYLGPIDINRMGRHDYYLWIGMASTVDWAVLDETRPQAATLVLVVDGVPMDFPLAPWHPGLDALPYPLKAPVYDTFVARASLDQLERIAAANSVTVQFALDDGRGSSYELWSGRWLDWTQFTARMANPQPVRQARRE